MAHSSFRLGTTSVRSANIPAATGFTGTFTLQLQLSTRRVTSSSPHATLKSSNRRRTTRQAAAIVRRMAVATHGNVNSQNIPWLVDEIAKVAPSAYQNGAMPN